MPFTPEQLAAAQAYVVADEIYKAAERPDANAMQMLALYHAAQVKLDDLCAICAPWPLQHTVIMAVRAERMTLPAILAQMEAATQNSDQVRAHADADDLLCMLILRLTQGGDIAADGAAIIAAYQRVGRWYV